MMAWLSQVRKPIVEHALQPLLEEYVEAGWSIKELKQRQIPLFYYM